MSIRYELCDHVATITIDRPERRNALDIEHWFALSNAWKRFRDDADAWVAIVTGVEGSFCVGADLQSFVPAANAALNAGRDDIDGIPIACTFEATLRTLDIFKPIIAAINGHCVAGGMEMMGGCDIRVASATATFAVTEPRVGLIAAGGTTARLPRQLAWPAAMEILLTADTLDAARARELGLVNDVVPDDELLARAQWWARRITRNAPLAVAATKESALRGWRAGSIAEAYAIEEELADRIRRTDDAAEGPAAFVEKREPRWAGR